MKRHRLPSAGLLIGIAVILAINIYTVFGPRGILRLKKLHQDLYDIKASAAKTQQENERLKNEVNLLQKDDRYIEKMAREELGLVREGELLYRKKAQISSPVPRHQQEPTKR